MTEDKERCDQITKWILRIARAWSIPIIGFTLLMLTGYAWSWMTTGVADPYVVEEVSFLEILPLIFMILGVIGLAVAWRREKIGGAVTLISQVAVIFLLSIQRPIKEGFNQFFIPLLMSVVVAIPGGLFSLFAYRSRQEQFSQK